MNADRLYWDCRVPIGGNVTVLIATNVDQLEVASDYSWPASAFIRVHPWFGSNLMDGKNRGIGDASPVGRIQLPYATQFDGISERGTTIYSCLSLFVWHDPSQGE